MTPEKLNAAVQLIKAGNKQAAIPLLREIIRENPNDENAWLWLYACVDGVEQKQACLQKVLAINPGNQSARQALAKLIDPASQPASGNKAPRKRDNRRRWVLPLVAILFLILCLVPGVYLFQSGQISSLAANLPFIPSQTLTITPTFTLTATVTPSPSPRFTSTLVPSPTLRPTPTPSEVTEIVWFIDFSTWGGLPQDVAAIESVVERFNASQGFIDLNLEVSSSNEGGKKIEDALRAIKGPDIIGPIFLLQSGEVRDQWLDLGPYVTEADREPYSPQLLESYQTDQGLLSLPFIVNPSVLFYNRQLFDNAGLKYPPARYGEKYEMPDGSQVEWNWDTLAAVARLLTLDDKGLNTTQDGFDKETIVQYGYSWAFIPFPAYVGSYWGDGSIVARDGVTAQIPEVWHAAWEWTYDGIWGAQPFIPSKKVETSEFLGKGEAFGSGKVGMAVGIHWSLSTPPKIDTWDVAAIPSYEGKPGGQVDAYNFFIWKGSPHPREAYFVLSYLLKEGVPKLVNPNSATYYTSMSARKDRQQAWVDVQKARFPWVTNWDVFFAGLDYPTTPSALSYVPNWNEAWKSGETFYNRVFGEPNLNLAAEEQKYIDALNNIFAEFFP